MLGNVCKTNRRWGSSVNLGAALTQQPDVEPRLCPCSSTRHFAHFNEYGEVGWSQRGTFKFLVGLVVFLPQNPHPSQPSPIFFSRKKIKIKNLWLRRRGKLGKLEARDKQRAQPQWNSRQSLSPLLTELVGKPESSQLTFLKDFSLGAINKCFAVWLALLIGLGGAKSANGLYDFFFF